MNRTLLYHMVFTIICLTSYVVIPTRRSTAEAFQILVSHAFGDAGSPYLIGALSDLISSAWQSNQFHSNSFTTSYLGYNDNVTAFYSLQYSLFTTCFVEVLGGIFFLVTAIYIVKDKLSAEREVRGKAYPERIIPKNGEMIKLSVEAHLLSDEKHNLQNRS